MERPGRQSDKHFLAIGVAAIMTNMLSIAAIVVGFLAVATLFGWIDPNISGFIEDLSAIRSVLDALSSIIGG